MTKLRKNIHFEYSVQFRKYARLYSNLKHHYKFSHFELIRLIDLINRAKALPKLKDILKELNIKNGGSHE